MHGAADTERLVSMGADTRDANTLGRQAHCEGRALRLALEGGSECGRRSRSPISVRVRVAARLGLGLGLG